jgi:hypothetical protein
MTPFFPFMGGMSRPLRYLPEGGSLVEVTCRTLHARFLLRPCPQWNQIALGVLGRAQRLYGVQIHVFTFLSTHFHLLATFRDAGQMAHFMRYLNTNLSKEAGRLVDWREKLFPRRYQAIPVTEEDGAQTERFRYILAHGCKEGLVERLREWPGVHCVRALLDRQPLEGLWFNRTQEYAARYRREEYDRLRYAESETVTLSPLPCWRDLSAETRRQRIAQMVEEIEADAARMREQSGRPVLGAQAIITQDPHARPLRPKKSPAPRIHAASKRARQEFTQAYRLFVSAFRVAAESLRAGNREAGFPIGCFPPALPFVGG